MVVVIMCYQEIVHFRNITHLIVVGACKGPGGAGNGRRVPTENGIDQEFYPAYL